MNKINCPIQSNYFGALPVGAIFVIDEDFCIKIDRNAIYEDLEISGICDEADDGDCECCAGVEMSSLPNAIRLEDGLAMYFDHERRVDMAFANAILSIS